MLFRRSIALNLATLLLLLTMGTTPVRSAEGELFAQEATAKINVRAAASTISDVVTTADVGDRVQILSQSEGSDGQRWYRIKLKSGESGWVRGDLIRVIEAPQATKASPAKPSTSAKPVPLEAPQPPTSAKSASPNQPNASSTPPKETASPTPPTKPAPKDTSASSGESGTSSTIVSFQTPSYAIRIFSEAGQLRLNLFNRVKSRLVLKAVPVESKSNAKSTIYRYKSDLKLTIVVPLSGQPTLTADVLGDTIREQSETSVTAPDP
jgi:uncharacterized protein YgiM (DUF1202 family)